MEATIKIPTQPRAAVSPINSFNDQQQLLLVSIQETQKTYKSAMKLVGVSMDKMRLQIQ